MDSTQFFNELFEGIVDTGIFMYVWSPGQGSTYFTSPEQAGAYVAANKDGKDVYYGMGVTKAVLAKDKRPTNMQVCGIPGLWLDIDIAGPAHKKQNLPPTREDAIDLLESNLPFKPTILVDSGHGLHAYWLFKEPWKFETEDERIQAATLLRRFVLSFKYHAAVRGWTLDSVFDLARVLRVPGTMNCKSGESLPCSVMSFEADKRYNPEDFEPFLVDHSVAGTDDHISEMLSADKNPLGLTLRVGATPPHQKVETLRTVEPKFDATWERNRPDLKDQSLSTYEMSLVSLTVSYGWGNQEIADAVVAFRRKHGKSQKEINKGMRVDYITRTIMKARKEQKQGPVDPKVLELSQQTMASNKDPSSNQRPSKDQIRDALEGLLQIRIDKIIKYKCDNPVFEIRLSNGTVVPVGPIEKLITQRNLKHAIAAHCGAVPRSVKSNVWDEYATLMMELVETQEPLAEDATQKGVLASMLTQYLERHGILDDMESAFHSMRPFWHKGRVWMFSKHFVNWAKFNAEPISLHEFSMTAKSMGIETDKKHFQVGEGDKKARTTKAVYDVTAFIGAAAGCPLQAPEIVENPEFGLEVVQ